KERADRIALANQRHLLNHFKLATELGAELVQIQSAHIIDSIIQLCKERQISTVCLGSPAFKIPQMYFSVFRYKKLIDIFSQANIDLIIFAC
ncbi:MAG: sensor protein KdpD, partial [Bacteroidales bacterium]